MKYRAARIGLVLIAAAAAAVVGLAAQGQQPTFQSRVEVILIDVNVIDSNGKPVSDLRPEDFTVTVDRKPRAIASAVFVDHMRVGIAPAAKPAATSGSAKPPSSIPPRHVIIAVDEDSLDLADAAMATRSSRRFLDRLGPTDRVGIVTIPRIATWINVSTNRAEAKATLDKVTGRLEAIEPVNPYRIGVFEAIEIIEHHDQNMVEKIARRNCDTQPTWNNPEKQTALADLPVGCVSAVMSEAEMMAVRIKAKTQQTFDALTDLGRQLGKLPGPKTLVLVSGGMFLPEASAAYRTLELSLAAAQVSLYTLFIEHPDYGGARARPSPSELDDSRMARVGVEDMTTAAGGTILEVIGTVEAQFDRVALELSGTWLLGIEVEPKDRDARPHSVHVTVDRPGVELRARRQYMIDPAALPAVPVEARPAPPALPPRSAVAPSPAAGVAATPKDLEPFMTRAEQYVASYFGAFAALFAEERQEMKVSRWTASPPGAPAPGAWIAESERVLRSEYLLVRAAVGPTWEQIHDVFEVDGKSVRERDGRLRTMFLESPSGVVNRALAISLQSATYQIGFVDRNVNVPTMALLFLRRPGNFVFVMNGEEKLEGVTVSRIAFIERGSPTIIQGPAGDVPVEGTLWIDPQQGRIVKSFARMIVGAVEAEITVTYRPTGEPGDLWVPTEVAERYTKEGLRFECMSRYSNFRKYEIDGQQ